MYFMAIHAPLPHQFELKYILRVKGTPMSVRFVFPGYVVIPRTAPSIRFYLMIN